MLARTEAVPAAAARNGGGKDMSDDYYDRQHGEYGRYNGQYGNHYDGDGYERVRYERGQGSLLSTIFVAGAIVALLAPAFCAMGRRVNHGRIVAKTDARV